jgi:hypothetical protein
MSHHIKGNPEYADRVKKLWESLISSFISFRGFMMNAHMERGKLGLSGFR